MIDSPQRMASLLAFCDYESTSIALALNEHLGVPGPQALEIADRATAAAAPQRRAREELVRKHYADALASEHEV